MEKIALLNAVQAAIPKLRGPLGGPLTPAEGDVLRKAVNHPEWAWDFGRRQTIGGPGLVLEDAVIAVDPKHDRTKPPSPEVFVAALRYAGERAASEATS
jgi:hypothetical protein